MRLISKQTFCFLVCSIFTFNAISQEKQELKVILSKIESEHDVKFSFTESDVKNISLLFPNTLSDLSQKIDYLNVFTLLNFKFISERYITISTIDKKIKVCGIVVINDNKIPLYGASIVQKNTTNGKVSDKYGAFELNNVAINSDIVISYIGFKTYTIKAQELWHTNGCKTIQLIENSEELEQVVISKYLTTGIQKQNDGSVIVNTEKFGILPGLTEPDILQSIQALPGVESLNESIANINVRGGTNDQNFILWDGIKMYHSGHFFGLISAYNPYLTEEVKVIKNGTSAEYGDGVSSTLNMLTSDEINEEFSGGFGANLLNADAYFKIPVSKKIAFHVSGRRSYTDIYSSPTYDNYFERSFQDSDLTLSNSNENSQDSDFFFTITLQNFFMT